MLGNSGNLQLVTVNEVHNVAHWSSPIHVPSVLIQTKKHVHRLLRDPTPKFVHEQASAVIIVGGPISL